MKILSFRFILCCVIIFVLSACASVNPYYKTSPDLNSIIESDIDYELFLVGDIGSSEDEKNLEVIELIKSQLDINLKNQSVIFLGNSINPEGSNEDSEDHLHTSEYLAECVRLIKEKTENFYFIPGNNEWYDGSDYSVRGIKHSEEILEKIADQKKVLKPSDGCGEPKIIDLTDELILVLTDSQWLMQGDSNEERKKSKCELDNNIEFITYLKEILAKNKRKNIIIAAHHPIFANGKTAGNFPLINHLLPLPILGSLITGIKSIAAPEQHFGHPNYEAYRAAMNSALENCEGCIVASAHENSMQHFIKGNNHYLIAGSGSKVDYASKADGSSFSYMAKGYAKITHTKNLELFLEFFTYNENQPLEPKLVYKILLNKKEIQNTDDQVIFKNPGELPKTYVSNISDLYSKKQFLRGEFYRKAWAQEVEIPILLLDESHGGLKPVQQGGGFQTRSLRLENDKGQQWVLRSVDKDVEKVVPAALRGTFAQSLVQDGIGSSHPFGAYAIPKLAEAAGIFHANPKLIYLPHQKALGEYDSEFAEGIYLFEERPGGKTKEFDNFGNTKKTISTADLLEKLIKNHNSVVDQNSVLRARLFDVWIGDWDRHDDQWRWGEFEEGKKEIYRPIPRDRDQVFFKNDGVLDYLASRPYFNPGLRKFGNDIDFYPGLIFNARYFDRSFLNALSKEDFLSMAKLLQNNLTDDIIDRAFLDWPKEIQALDAESIKSKLRQRRSKLQEYALMHYHYINKEITIPGTESDNYFDIRVIDKNLIEVVVYHEKKNKKHIIYQNTISNEVTNELRLFGLGKKDIFHFSGHAKNSIKVIVVGGSGKDKIKNESQLDITVYDRPDGMEAIGTKVNSKLKDKNGINSYDRSDWKQNRFWQFPLLTFYTDEGLGMSYNIWWTKHGFRSSPFKSNHKLSLSYFWKNDAITAKYNGLFINSFGNWDLGLDVLANAPTFTQFYYGLGNNYINFENRFPNIEEAGSPKFHIIKGSRIDINPSLLKKISRTSTIKINPSFEFLDLTNSDDTPRYYLTSDANIPLLSLEKKYYLGFGVGINSTRLDNPTVPAKGFVFDLAIDYKYNLKNSDYSNITFNTNLSTYIAFNQLKTVVLAMHIGAAHTIGETEFFHSNYLASTSRLRGFKTNRFGGQSIVYHSNDLRLTVLKSKGAFPLSLGVFTAFDYGRSWYDKDTVANKWHTSYGGGIFFIPMDAVGFKIGYYKGEEDIQLSIGGALSF